MDLSKQMRHQYSEQHEKHSSPWKSIVDLLPVLERQASNNNKRLGEWKVWFKSHFEPSVKHTLLNRPWFQQLLHTNPRSDRLSFEAKGRAVH
jgi:hypothetical protein